MITKHIRISAVLAAILAVSIAFGQRHKEPPMPAHKISASQAQFVALKKYPGHVEGKVALENEDGKWQYAVNIRTGKKLREVMVDAKSGRIASVEVTSAREEAREKAAEEKKKHNGGI